MSAFQKQLEAVAVATRLIERLPAHAVWALEVTNDDDADSPTVLNIFAPVYDFPGIAMSLRLGKAVDRGEKDVKFVSYRQGTLHISIIEEE